MYLFINAPWPAVKRLVQEQVNSLCILFWEITGFSYKRINAKA